VNWKHEMDGWVTDAANDNELVALVMKVSNNYKRNLRMVEAAPYLLRMCWKLLGALQRANTPETTCLVIQAREELVRITNGTFYPEEAKTAQEVQQ